MKNDLTARSATYPRSRWSNDQRQSARADRERLVKSRRGLGWQRGGNTQKFVAGGSLFGEFRVWLISILELLSSPSQCLLRLFLVQLLYPCSQNCCVAQKA